MYPRQEDVSLLQRFINEHKLEEKGVPMSELRRLHGTDQIALGVDGTKIVDLITQSVREKEKMAIYTNTTPFVVYDKIGEICRMLQSIKNCSVFFVFNGISFLPSINEESARDKNMMSVEIAALNGTDKSRVCNLQASQASDFQKKACSRFVVEEDVESQIVKLFGSEFQGIMRAPYYAWAQLSAFCHQDVRYVSEVYGCLELLAFPGIDRVITNINTMKGTVDIVRKSRFLDILPISEEDLGCMILIDSRNRVMKHAAHRFSSFEEMRKKIVRRDNMSLGSSYLMHLEEDYQVSNAARQRTSSLKNAVMRNLSVLEVPVLTLTFPFCVPLSRLYDPRQQVPVYSSSLLGLQLSPVMYYMLSAGLLSPTLFGAFSYGSLVDDWPLVDSIKYRIVAETVLPLRVQTVYHLAESLHIKDYGMTWFRRYNIPSVRVSKIYPPNGTRLDSWDLSGINIPDKIFLVDVLGFSHMAVSSRPVVCQTVAETTAAIFLHTLDLLGYLAHGKAKESEEMQTIEPSSFGHALAFCGVRTLSEYAVLLIELTRTGSITTDEFRMTSEPVPPQNIPKEIIFASRILSIIPLNVSGPWTGPIDTELAAFSMISRMVSRSIRHLIETMMVLMFQYRKTTVPIRMITEIQASLPFSTPVEFGGGVLIKYILMNEGCTLNDLAAVFPECAYLQHDLAALFYFWDLANIILPKISSQDVHIDLNCLSKANELMNKARVNLGCNTVMGDVYY